MKTIEEASEEFEKENGEKIWHKNENSGSILCVESFKSGVEFAQRWIDISDEMPEVGVQILTKNGDKVGLSLPLTMWDIKDITEFATHWRPIELK